MNYLKDQRGWPMHNSQLREAMGLDPKKHLPIEGTEPVMVTGLLVRVFPKMTKNRFEHRTRAQCPECNKWIEAGHFGQHWRIHK